MKHKSGQVIKETNFVNGFTVFVMSLNCISAASLDINNYFLQDKEK